MSQNQVASGDALELRAQVTFFVPSSFVFAKQSADWIPPNNDADQLARVRQALAPALEAEAAFQRRPAEEVSTVDAARMAATAFSAAESEDKDNAAIDLELRDQYDQLSRESIAPTPTRYSAVVRLKECNIDLRDRCHLLAKQVEEANAKHAVLASFVKSLGGPVGELISTLAKVTKSDAEWLTNKDFGEVIRLAADTLAELASPKKTRRIRVDRASSTNPHIDVAVKETLSDI